MTLDRTLIASTNSLDTVNIEDSLQNGHSCKAIGAFSHAEGFETTAAAECAHSDGRRSNAKDSYSYVWNGRDENYASHGEGTFNINPVNGLYGFYIGNKNLETYFQQLIYSKDDILASNNNFTGNNTFGGRTIFDADVTFDGTVSAYGNGTKVNFTGANVYTKPFSFVRSTKPTGDDSYRAATVGYVFDAASGFINNVGTLEELNSYGGTHAASLEYVRQFARSADSQNPGMVVLYDSLGLNNDGTMTQKAIKEAIDSAIKPYPFATPTVSGVMYLFNDANLTEKSKQGTMTQDAIVKYIRSSIEGIPKASPTVFGKTRMYSSDGENTDGTMTQLAINNFVQEQISQNVLQANESRQGVMYLFNETEHIFKDGSIDESKSKYGTFTSDWIYRNKPVLNLASPTVSGGVYLYNDKGQNTNGTITQKWISEHIPSDATQTTAGKVKLSSGTSESDSDARDSLTTMTKEAILSLTIGHAQVDSGKYGKTQLWSSVGENTDGTMTQKGISEILRRRPYLVYSDNNIRVWSNHWCEQSDEDSVLNKQESRIKIKQMQDSNYYVFTTSVDSTLKREVAVMDRDDDEFTVRAADGHYGKFSWCVHGFLSNTAYENNYKQYEI